MNHSPLFVLSPPHIPRPQLIYRYPPTELVESFGYAQQNHFKSERSTNTSNPLNKRGIHPPSHVYDQPAIQTPKIKNKPGLYLQWHTPHNQIHGRQRAQSSPAPSVSFCTCMSDITTKFLPKHAPFLLFFMCLSVGPGVNTRGLTWQNRMSGTHVKNYR